MPSDSYTRPFLQALDDYSSLVVATAAYFRHVDQSDPAIQRQMIGFVDDLARLPQVSGEPDFCWVRDMYRLFELKNNIMEEIEQTDTFKGLSDDKKQKLAFMLDTFNKGNFTFEEKLNIALKVPGVQDMYGEDIVRDELGRITASRCYIFVRHLDLHNIHEQIDMLNDANEVAMEQPINQLPENEGEMPFFLYDNLMAYW